MRRLKGEQSLVKLMRKIRSISTKLINQDLAYLEQTPLSTMPTGLTNMLQPLELSVVSQSEEGMVGYPVWVYRKLAGAALNSLDPQRPSR